ncbi:hypothetical protein HMPREF1624_05713 [Sporothrix schenckii ATCC 58251]|uniref:Uncharacterized protein n=1 Tax=Sporothrix schenckii (strain ATCC 58251 / de Perez 2211183) TaxID=1391915 RepID=U7PS23_SPOS1|nr:hypothetical protein HMPREF1624_05713 [Sporothrix schenckii ATCC 58251]
MTKATVATHSVPNTRQTVIDTEHGPFQVMVSWPLDWHADGTPKDAAEDVAAVPVIFVLDGNAYFLSATDIARRQQFEAKRKSIIVAIGYPDAETETVYVPARRSFDLTPPAKKGLPQWPVKDADGREVTDGDGHPVYMKLGGAATFHATLVDVVIPLLSRELLPSLPAWDRLATRVLSGHSFGGLFTLYALFTSPGLFDVYMAASPSIWFNDESIVAEQEAAFLGQPPPAAADGRQKPVLYLNSGTGEELDVFPKPDDTDATFKARQDFLAEKHMCTNTRAMAARLQKTEHFADVWLQEFTYEDHMSAAVVALQRGMNKLHREWWVGK